MYWAEGEPGLAADVTKFIEYPPSMVKIILAGHHDLDPVPFPQGIEGSKAGGPGNFVIDHQADIWVGLAQLPKSVGGNGTVGLNGDLVTVRKQAVEKLVDSIFLEEGFTPGDGDLGTTMEDDLVNDLVYRHLLARHQWLGLGDVAVGAFLVTTGQADKSRWYALPPGIDLAVDGLEDGKDSHYNFHSTLDPEVSQSLTEASSQLGSFRAALRRLTIQITMFSAVGQCQGKSDMSLRSFMHWWSR